MDKAYRRNLIKDKLQDYLLNFVYNSREFKNLIFTGGTCLRKMYGLPRLSEDLDFDYKEEFDVEAFAKKSQEYLLSLKKFSQVETKITQKGNTVFFKFPASDFEEGFQPREVIFVRCDFSQVKEKSYKTEVLPYSFELYDFFVNCYDLPTLFANKLIAFIEREFFKGKNQQIPFKGRDVFDIFWFINLSAKGGFTLKPNWQFIFEKLKIKDKEEFLEKVEKKILKLDEDEVKADLTAFVEDREYLENFLKGFKTTISSKIYFIS